MILYHFLTYVLSILLKHFIQFASFPQKSPFWRRILTLSVPLSIVTLQWTFDVLHNQQDLCVEAINVPLAARGLIDQQKVVI